MVKKVLKDLGCRKSELSLLFTDDEYIASLNKRFLKKDGPTNVLAFPMLDDEISGMLGDVVISIDTIIRESQELNEPVDQRLFRLLIHGILHLLGYDHERSPKDEEIMLLEENRLLRLVMKE